MVCICLVHAAPHHILDIEECLVHVLAATCSLELHFSNSSFLVLELSELTLQDVVYLLAVLISYTNDSSCYDWHPCCSNLHCRSSALYCWTNRLCMPFSISCSMSRLKQRLKCCISICIVDLVISKHIEQLLSCIFSNCIAFVPECLAFKFTCRQVNSLAKQVAKEAFCQILCIDYVDCFNYKLLFKQLLALLSLHTFNYHL